MRNFEKRLLDKVIESEFFKNLQPNDKKIQDLRKLINNRFSEVSKLIKDTAKTVHRKDKTEGVQKICENIKANLYPKIEKIIQASLDIFSIEKFSMDDTASIKSTYQSIEKGISELLNLSIKDSQEVGNLLKDSSVEIISQYLTYNMLHDKIYKAIENKANQAIVNETDGDGNTLLHLACQKGNIEFVECLTDKGWKNERLAAKYTPEEIAKQKGHANLVDSFKKKPVPIRKEGGMGMIARMGAMTSPAKKITFSGEGMQIENEQFPKKVLDSVRPVKIVDPSGKAITPGGSELYPTWEIIVDIDKPERERKVFTVFLDELKADEKLETSKNPPKAMPPNFPENTKVKKKSEEFSARVTKEVLEKWEKIKTQSNNVRYRDQNSTMGSSAAIVAAAAGYRVANKRDWQWCHIFAYSLGGEDGILPVHRDDYDSKGPQRENNMVLGTVEANAQMLVIEDIVKNLIKHKGIPTVYIICEPTFVNGLESYHVCETLRYTIQDEKVNPKYQVTFSFSMLSRRKIVFQEPPIIARIVEHLFLTKGPELTKDITFLPPTDMSHGDPFKTPDRKALLGGDLAITDEKEDKETTEMRESLLELPLRNLSFSDSGSENPPHLDTSWFTDDEMNSLMDHFFGHLPNVKLVAGINIYQGRGETLIQNLQEVQLQQILQESIGLKEDTIIIPINLKDRHWAALYIYFNTTNRSSPQIGYFDPFGDKIPTNLAQQLSILYTGLKAGDIFSSPIPLQNDSYNCGPWVIAIFEHLIRSRGLGLPDEKFKIQVARVRYREVLESIAQETTQNLGKTKLKSSGFTKKQPAHQSDVFLPHLSDEIHDAEIKTSSESNQTQDKDSEHECQVKPLIISKGAQRKADGSIKEDDQENELKNLFKTIRAENINAAEKIMKECNIKENISNPDNPSEKLFDAAMQIKNHETRGQMIAMLKAAMSANKELGTSLPHRSALN